MPPWHWRRSLQQNGATQTHYWLFARHGMFVEAHLLHYCHICAWASPTKILWDPWWVFCKITYNNLHEIKTRFTVFAIPCSLALCLDYLYYLILWRAGTMNNTPHILWDTINCLCTWHMLNSPPPPHPHPTPHPPPSATYMRQWIGSALLQIMACSLFRAKPLSKPILGYCLFDT